MNAQRFDDFAQQLGHATVRRRVLFGLALGPVAGLVAAQRLGDVAAKKKHKKKRKPKKPQLNDYGCLDVGQPCKGNSSICCSGICEGTKPKKGKKDSSRCAAHDAAICQVDSDLCSTGVPHACNGSNLICTCLLTTGNGGFCGDGSRRVCQVCSQDAECQEAHGAGAACVVFGGICDNVCPETGGTGCVPACKDAEK